MELRARPRVYKVTMFELLLQRRACPGCRASGQGPLDGGDAHPAHRGGAFLQGSYVGGHARTPAERSGLAYAAGFAGVGYLFHFSLVPLAVAQAGWGFAESLMFVWGLTAPAALALSFAAAVSLDRSPRKSGRLPALFGFFAGWYGIAAWLSLLDGRLLLYPGAF
jgi:hypothetical protein